MYKNETKSLLLFKWVKKPSLKPETLKLLEKNSRENKLSYRQGQAFLKRNPVAQQIKATAPTGGIPWD